MLLAIIGALLQHHIITYKWIIVGFVVGAMIGAPMAIWMPMTAVPQRTALSHAFGALAAALVGTAHYYLFDYTHADQPIEMGFLSLEVLLGGLTFTGSLMAFGKLQELLADAARWSYKNQNLINLGILAVAFACGVALTINPALTWLFPILLVVCAGVWRAADHADRRGRHAHRHRAAEQLRRSVGQHDGFRAQQQAADHRRRP